MDFLAIERQILFFVYLFDSVLNLPNYTTAMWELIVNRIKKKAKLTANYNLIVQPSVLPEKYPECHCFWMGV